MQFQAKGNSVFIFIFFFYQPGIGPALLKWPPPAVDCASIGMSNNLSIICIFCCRAFIRPLVSLCFAAIHRIWSSKINLAARRGMGRTWCEVAGLWTVMWSERLSSLSPVTSIFCWKNSKSHYLKTTIRPGFSTFRMSPLSE